MSKLVILLSFALFFSIVVAQEDETNELIAICKSVNDPKQPPEVIGKGKECNDILQGITQKKGKKEDSVKIRFMGGSAAISAFSVASTSAMDSVKGQSTEQQNAAMLKIKELRSDCETQFKKAVDEFNAAIGKPGGNEKYKPVDALITTAGLRMFNIQTTVDSEFKDKSQTPEFLRAVESGVQFLNAVSRIKLGISQL